MKIDGTRIDFTKMQGCGNDYIYIDCFRHRIAEPEPLAIRLSDRHFGVGGDGLVLICPSDAADAHMRMFNADGSEGMMCGNAIRCVAKLLYDKGIVPKEMLRIDTMSGVKELRLAMENGLVTAATVNMGRAELNPARIPSDFTGERVIDRPESFGGVEYRVTCVSMGNPHCVVFVDEPEDMDLPRLGPDFEHSPLFPERVNTEFVKVIDGNTLRMRVWERGSGETLACGTGACAAAVAAVENGFCREGEDIRVILRGGELIINYTGDGVLMTGGCETVFEGEIEI